MKNNIQNKLNIMVMERTYVNTFEKVKEVINSFFKTNLKTKN